ncbi:MAG: peptidylprolyl isomerase [Bacillota bacterium]
MKKSVSCKVLAAVIAILLMTVALASGCSSGGTAAVVNGEAISTKQLDETVQNMIKSYQAYGYQIDEKQDADMVAMIRSQAIDNLINKTILLQEAKKMELTVTPEEVDKELANIKGKMSEEDYRKRLQDSGLTELKLRQEIEKSLLISKLEDKVVADVPPATVDQAREYYQQNKEEFLVPVQYQVRHILAMTMGKDGDPAQVDLEARTKILSILEQINQGKDFAELARQNSEDPGSASDGGLFTFSPGEADPAFDAAAKALKPGEITKDPVKSQYGYHLIKMEKITPEKQKTFDEVKDEIISKLTGQAQMEKANKFLEDAKSRAQIVNYIQKAEEQQSQTGQNADNSAPQAENKGE